ncbi:MAG: hypothetical protein BWK77_04755 [Verrucomicrobia bacterium A1]|nr:MAG: hypothetical protein BWK77_04755 [Verrucomicrobia bacterium A1]
MLFSRTFGTAAAALLLAVSARAEPTQLPADFPAVFEELASLVDQSEVSGMDMARGSYLATKYFRTGPVALPYLQGRFSAAHAPGEASMAGLFVTIHGKIEELYALRKELETNQQKRRWVYDICGNEENFFVSMENAEIWEPLTALIPSTSGPRNFAICCIHSKDPLVRLAGLYWGYWMQDATYWKLARQCAATDPDPAVRKIASRLK